MYCRVFFKLKIHIESYFLIASLFESFKTNEKYWQYGTGTVSGGSSIGIYSTDRLALQILHSARDLRADDVVAAAFLQLTQQVFVASDVPEAAVEPVQGVPPGSDQSLLPLEEEELAVRAIRGLIIPSGAYIITLSFVINRSG